MRKGILMFFGILVVLAAVIVPSSMLVLGDDSPEIDLDQAIQVDFFNRYQDSQLLQIMEPQDMRVIYWRSQEAMFATLWVDGLWVELASQPLQQGANGSTE